MSSVNRAPLLFTRMYTIGFTLRLVAIAFGEVQDAFCTCGAAPRTHARASLDRVVVVGLAA